MQRGKNPNRYVAVDLNPTNIGCSVLEKVDDKGNYKVINVWSYDFSCYFDKKGYASNDKRQKHYNNKRKYELTVALKQLFKIALHYDCSHFVMEDLNCKATDKLSREANRKTRNLWCRDLTTNIITKRCNECGIELIEVNPCYSSFIGNIQHPYADSCSASVEIGRRGMYKYTKGMSFYPIVGTEDIGTLESMFGTDRDDLCGIGNWVAIYKSLKRSFDKKSDFEYRFRAGNVRSAEHSFSMCSCRSRVKVHEFSPNNAASCNNICI